MCVQFFACSSLFPDLEASGSLPFPKSAAAVATSLKKPITPGKPNLHVRPFKKQESENAETKPPSPVSKAPPSIPKPVSQGKTTCTNKGRVSSSEQKIFRTEDDSTQKTQNQKLYQAFL